MAGSAAWWWVAVTVVSARAGTAAGITVSTEAPTHVVSSRFLSLTIDPALLMDGEYAPGIPRVMALARGLAPAFVRLGSSASNRYKFLRTGAPWPADASYTVSEAQWMILNDVARRSGLEPIVCVNVASRRPRWDTANLRELLSYSDRRKYTLSWQLGYELQTLREKVSGEELGKDARTFRKILDGFPRYKKSGLSGPDILVTGDPQDEAFLKDFLKSAGDAVSAVTWHAFENITDAQFDKDIAILEVQRKELAEKLGEEFTNKPLWIGESCREPARPSRFEGGLRWAAKLGAAARLGAHVLLQRPQALSLHTPTPDYWVSYLHKALVGEAVLGVAGGGAGQAFAQCSAGRRYPAGSVTVFAVNRRPRPANLTLGLASPSTALSVSTSAEVHEFLLTEGGEPSPLDLLQTTLKRIPQVLLNGRQLTLDLAGNLPVLTPKVHQYTNNMIVTLPAKSVGFWVLSGVKVSACLPKNSNNLNKNAVQTGSNGKDPNRGKRSVEDNRSSQERDDANLDIEGVMSEHDIKEARDKSDIKEDTSNHSSNGELPIDEDKDNVKRKSKKKIIRKKDKHRSSSSNNKTEKSNFGTEISIEETKRKDFNASLTANINYNDAADGKNGTNISHSEEANTGDNDMSKYRISKVLVVFENKFDEPVKGLSSPEIEELQLDEDLVNSNEKEVNRVSRALDSSAFRLPTIPLSLFDIAALREPLISLKILREKRWHELQKRKLLAGQEYKKALDLQASMLFPKPLLPNIPKLSLIPATPSESTEKTNQEYDYVAEEDHNSREPGLPLAQYPSVDQWSFHDSFPGQDPLNKRNAGQSKHTELWEVEKPLVTNSNGPNHHSSLHESYRQLPQAGAPFGDGGNVQYNRGESAVPKRSHLSSEGGYLGPGGPTYTGRDQYNMHENLYSGVTSVKRKRRTDDEIVKEGNEGGGSKEGENRSEGGGVEEGLLQTRDRRHLEGDAHHGDGLFQGAQGMLEDAGLPTISENTPLNNWETRSALEENKGKAFGQLSNDSPATLGRGQEEGTAGEEGPDHSQQGGEESDERYVRHGDVDVTGKGRADVHSHEHSDVGFKSANHGLNTLDLFPSLPVFPTFPKFSPLPKFDSHLVPGLTKVPELKLPSLHGYGLPLLSPLVPTLKHDLQHETHLTPSGYSFLPAGLVPKGVLPNIDFHHSLNHVPNLGLDLNAFTRHDNPLHGIGLGNLVPLKSSSVILPPATHHIPTLSHLQDDFRVHTEQLKDKLEELKEDAEDTLHFSGKSVDGHDPFRDSLFKSSDLARTLEKSLKSNQQHLEKQLSALVGLVPHIQGVQPHKVLRSVESHSQSKEWRDSRGMEEEEDTDQHYSKPSSLQRTDAGGLFTNGETVERKDAMPHLPQEPGNSMDPAERHRDFEMKVGPGNGIPDYLQPPTIPSELDRYKRNAIMKESQQILKDKKENKIYCQKLMKRSLVSKELEFLYPTNGLKESNFKPKLTNCMVKDRREIVPDTSSHLSNDDFHESTLHDTCYPVAKEPFIINMKVDGSHPAVEETRNGVDVIQVTQSTPASGLSDRNYKEALHEHNIHTHYEPISNSQGNVEIDGLFQNFGNEYTDLTSYKKGLNLVKKMYLSKLVDVVGNQQNLKPSENKMYGNRLKRFVRVISTIGDSKELLDNKLHVSDNNEDLDVTSITEDLAIGEKYFDIFTNKHVNSVLKNHYNFKPQPHVHNDILDSKKDNLATWKVKGMNSMGVGKMDDLNDVLKDLDLEFDPKRLTTISEQTSQQPQPFKGNVDDDLVVVFNNNNNNSDDEGKTEKPLYDKSRQQENTLPNESGNKHIVTVNSYQKQTDKSSENIGFLSKIFKKICNAFYSLFKVL